MKELRNTLVEEFKDKEVRDIYCKEFLNASIATQIKVLREQRNMTQTELAELAGMKQSRIATIEDVNYSARSINTIRRIAEALDLALTVQFDNFGSKLFDILNLSRESLERDSFDDDPAFQEELGAESITLTVSRQNVFESASNDMRRDIRETGKTVPERMFGYTEQIDLVSQGCHIPEQPKDTFMNFSS